MHSVTLALPEFSRAPWKCRWLYSNSKHVWANQRQLFSHYFHLQLAKSAQHVCVRGRRWTDEKTITTMLWFHRGRWNFEMFVWNLKPQLLIKRNRRTMWLSSQLIASRSSPPLMFQTSRCSFSFFDLNFSDFSFFSFCPWACVLFLEVMLCSTCVSNLPWWVSPVFSCSTCLSKAECILCSSDECSTNPKEERLEEKNYSKVYV